MNDETPPSRPHRAIGMIGGMQRGGGSLGLALAAAVLAGSHESAETATATSPFLWRRRGVAAPKPETPKGSDPIRSEEDEQRLSLAAERRLRRKARQERDRQSTEAGKARARK